MDPYDSPLSSKQFVFKDFLVLSREWGDGSL